MIIATDRAVRERAVHLMGIEDPDLIDGMYNFRHLKGKPLYLEPIVEYGSEKELIICGPLQRVPDNAVYTNDKNYHRRQDGIRQLYVGENCLVEQTPCTWRIANDSFIFLKGNPSMIATLKKEVVRDFAKSAFVEVWPCQRYVIFKTLEDRKLVLDTLEGMAQSIDKWNLERSIAREKIREEAKNAEPYVGPLDV